MDLKAEEDARRVEEPWNPEVFAHGRPEVRHHFCVFLPHLERERMIELRAEQCAGEVLAVCVVVSDVLRRCPVARDIGQEQDDDAREEEFRALLFGNILHGSSLLCQMLLPKEIGCATKSWNVCPGSTVTVGCTFAPASKSFDVVWMRLAIAPCMASCPAE